MKDKLKNLTIPRGCLANNTSYTLAETKDIMPYLMFSQKALRPLLIYVSGGTDEPVTVSN